MTESDRDERRKKELLDETNVDIGTDHETIYCQV
jgi:hypothetical protein